MLDGKLKAKLPQLKGWPQPELGVGHHSMAPSRFHSPPTRCCHSQKQLWESQLAEADPCWWPLLELWGNGQAQLRKTLKLTGICYSFTIYIYIYMYKCVFVCSRNIICIYIYIFIFFYLFTMHEKWLHITSIIIYIIHIHSMMCIYIYMNTSQTDYILNFNVVWDIVI